MQTDAKIARKGCSVWPDYKYRYLSLSPSRTASSGPRVCHRVLRRSSLHRIPRVSRICPLQANHLRPRRRRAKATLGRSVQAYRIPPISNLPLALLSLEDPSTDTGQAKPTGCISSCARTCKYYYFHRYVQVQVHVHVMPSHISAGRLERKSATIPASAFRHLQNFPPPKLVYLPFSLQCFSS